MARKLFFAELARSAIEYHGDVLEGIVFKALARAAYTEGLLNKVSHRIHSIFLLLWKYSSSQINLSEITRR